jgi:hypothetical protein
VEGRNAAIDYRWADSADNFKRHNFNNGQSQTHKRISRAFILNASVACLMSAALPVWRG